MFFDATVKDVLRQIQNKDINPADFGGDSYIKSVMTLREGKIRGSIPARFSEMVNLGEIRGQILVKSAVEGQTSIDATQSIVDALVSGTLYLYKNWRECKLPVDNVDTALIDPDDYTVTGNVITFDAATLSKGNNIIANYNTDWNLSVGLEDLRWMLIEGSAIDLMRNAGVANNPSILDDIEFRKEGLDNAMIALKNGDQLPIGITQLKLIFEVEASDNSKTVSFSRIKRG